MRAILIAGPTASGKSAVAMTLAEKLGGTIINADSMQVYREMRVLTARPSEEDETRVPHLLYGFVPAAEAYSVGRWLGDVAEAVEQAETAGRVPIITGGTGLYFKALLEGLSPVPEIPERVRGRWRRIARDTGGAELHEMLRESDPVMAERLRPSDPQRIVRALETIEATGRSLAEWQQLPGEPVLGEDETRRLLVAPDRAWLTARVDARWETMLEEGALDDVRRLMSLGLDPGLPAMRALGVAPLSEHVRGKLSLEDAGERVKMETRRYAKRQMTWARSNMMSWKSINAQQIESSYPEIFSFIAV